MESFLLNTYPEPQACLTRGKGTFLYDRDGREYLDFLSGIAVVSLGHANDEITERIATQAATLNHVSNYFSNEYTQKVAGTINEKLSTSTGMNGKVFFSNSGAEANECAIKVAKRFGKHSRHKILTAKGSFHGRTIATLKATGQPLKHAAFEPLPDFVKYFDFGDSDSLRDAIDSECVAVMVEVIQGENGVQTASQDFFIQLREICLEHNLVLIVDEVQTGMCRTGKWFAFEHYGLKPDIVTMAKALGNGFPVGACWIRSEIADVMKPGDHGSTFGGQPLALSVVDKVLEIMERDSIAQHCAQIGETLRNSLENLEVFEQVRGKGLLIGCDLNEKVKKTAPEIVKDAMGAGLILNATSENTLRIAPPLIIGNQEIEQAISTLRNVIGKL